MFYHFWSSPWHIAEILSWFGSLVQSFPALFCILYLHVSCFTLYFLSLSFSLPFVLLKTLLQILTLWELIFVMFESLWTQNAGDIACKLKRFIFMVMLRWWAGARSRLVGTCRHPAVCGSAIRVIKNLQTTLMTWSLCGHQRHISFMDKCLHDNALRMSDMTEKLDRTHTGTYN